MLPLFRNKSNMTSFFVPKLKLHQAILPFIPTKILVYIKKFSGDLPGNIPMCSFQAYTSSVEIVCHFYSRDYKAILLVESPHGFLGRKSEFSSKPNSRTRWTGFYFIRCIFFVYEIILNISVFIRHSILL